MASKWLEWKPTSDTSETQHMGENPIIRVHEDGNDTAGLQIIEKTRIPPVPKVPKVAEAELVFDPYAQRLNSVFRQMGQPDYPEGMVSWLGVAYPRLYYMLTVHLPDRIQKMWSSSAPMDKFDAILERLLQTHREGCALYRASSRTRGRLEQNRDRSEA